MVNTLAGLDFYKLTMSQLARSKNRNLQVTFELKNRGANKLSDRVDYKELQEELDKHIGMDVPNYVRGLGSYALAGSYVYELSSSHLPPVEVSLDDSGEIKVSTTGEWWLATFWETIVMSTVNELYFKNLDKSHRTLGHSLLGNKIEILRSNKNIKFTDFGTRRRLSLDWQDTVLNRLVEEIPEQLAGTSNPYFANKYGIKAVGTFAHELPMVYGAIQDSLNLNPLDSHNVMLDDWFTVYGEDYSYALTDTFGSEFFFATFGEERARTWKGIRQDSGDPITFGLRAIKMYKSFGIDPKEKTLIFSDGLDLETIFKLQSIFSGEIGVGFGWGTNLMNDVGVKPNNIVMKVTKVENTGTVKLSDDEGKHTGTPENIARYIELRNKKLVK